MLSIPTVAAGGWPGIQRHLLELPPVSAQEPAGALALHCPDSKQGCGLDSELGNRRQGHGLEKGRDILPLILKVPESI